MAQLTSLPDELLVKIFIHVSDEEQFTLLRLALVNKRLNKVVSPLLVRHWPAHIMDRGQEIEQLAVHLLRHPELRDQVKSIRWNTDYSSHNIDPKDQRDLWMACGETFPELAPEADDEEGPELPDIDFSDVIATLVFTWAKDLTSLDYTVQDTQSYPDTTIFRTISLTIRDLMSPDPVQTLEPLLFSELREVTFRHSDTDGSFNGTFAFLFFLLPKLKSFSGYMPGLWDLRDPNDVLLGNHEVPELLSNDPDMPDIPIGTSPVQEIILGASEVSVPGLMLMVQACRRLRTSVYEPHLDSWNYRIGLRSLAHVLLLHASSLERVLIRIASPCVDLTEEAWDGSISLAESLRHLVNLKMLTMAIDLLFKLEEDGGIKIDTSRLPASIEHLQLENYVLIPN